MFEDRLPTSVWVDALIRRAQVAGASGFILHKGDAARGDVIVKVTNMQGVARAYAPRTNMDGERVFVDLRLQNIGTDEHDIDAYIAKARARDCDLWVVEIEDRELRHFLTEPVEVAAEDRAAEAAGGHDETKSNARALFPKLR